jgi:CPA2 family monovalent cation:H+ antiporter-2
MLFNPSILIRQPWAVAGTLLIILVGKSLAAWVIVLLFGHSQRVAITISASLAQIGEFAFMLAELGIKSDLLPLEGRDLILAGAILSIVMNPVWFMVVDWLQPRGRRAGPSTLPAVSAEDHVILVGHGRVGKLVNRALKDGNQPVVVIENNVELVNALRGQGEWAILGNAEAPGILEAAQVDRARLLISAIPNVFEAGQVIQRARALNPSIDVAARAHSDAEVEHLRLRGAEVVIMGEQEIARRMIEYVVEQR